MRIRFSSVDARLYGEINKWTLTVMLTVTVILLLHACPLLGVIGLWFLIGHLIGMLGI